MQPHTLAHILQRLAHRMPRAMPQAHGRRGLQRMAGRARLVARWQSGQAQHEYENMANAKRTDAKWINVDVATLDAGLLAGYQAYKAKYAEMKAAREAFEQAMNDEAELPEGKRMVFGYNFGKLSIAIVDDDRKPAKAQPAKMSLADFIASQAQAGARA